MSQLEKSDFTVQAGGQLSIDALEISTWRYSLEGLME
jgi:hypothetical protein